MLENEEEDTKMDILTLIMKYLLNSELGEAFLSKIWIACNTIQPTNQPATQAIESGDSGLLIAVIILAVIILLLFCGAGVAYVRYVRSVF